MRVVLVLALSACGFSGAAGNPPGNPGDASNGSNTVPTDVGPDMGPCSDVDGDGVCDVVDQCPGMDDKIDIDSDGVPDCKDDWPCGATKPNGPSQPLIVFQGGGQWSADHDHLGGGGNVVVVKAGMPIPIAFDWLLRVTCPGGGAQQQQCQAQLEIGFAGVGRDRCVFDGQLTEGNIHGGNVNDSMTIAPTPTGAYQAYDLRLNIGLRSSCGTSGWDGPEPGGNATFAKLCVVK